MFKDFYSVSAKNVFISIWIVLGFSLKKINLALKNRLDSWCKNNCSFEVSRHCNDN